MTTPSPPRATQPGRYGVLLTDDDPLLAAPKGPAPSADASDARLTSSSRTRPGQAAGGRWGAYREYVGVRLGALAGAVIVRQLVMQQQTGLVQALARLRVVIPSRRQACPQWCLGLDGRAHVPLAPWVPT